MVYPGGPLLLLLPAAAGGLEAGGPMPVPCVPNPADCCVADCIAAKPWCAGVADMLLTVGLTPLLDGGGAGVKSSSRSMSPAVTVRTCNT